MTTPSPPLSPPIAVLADTTNTATTSTTFSLTKANAVVDGTMAEERVLLTDENGRCSKWICGTKRSSSCIALATDHETRLKEILNKKSSNDVDVMHEVTECINDAIDALVQQGLHAFHMHETAARDLEHAKDEVDSKNWEIHRLRASDESSRITIMNLLRAVETSKNDARDASRHAQMEARLRSDLSSLRGERDEALGIAASLRRKVSLLDGDLQNTKQKLARVEQEKIKMERDNRAAMSLAKSVGTETSSDVEFYKRKTSELQNQLSAQHTLVAEQKAQIHEMRRQQERSMSQNRLANIRAEGANKERKSF